MSKEKKQSFMQGIITLMFSQVLIKILGLFYKLYLTNKNGFGDAGNAIYNSGFQIYALLLTISSIGVPNAVAKLISEKLSVGDNRGAQKIFKISKNRQKYFSNICTNFNKCLFSCRQNSRNAYDDFYRNGSFVLGSNYIYSSSCLPGICISIFVFI